MLATGSRMSWGVTDSQPRGTALLFLPPIPPPSPSLMEDADPPQGSLTCSRVVTGTLLVPIFQKGKERLQERVGTSQGLEAGLGGGGWKGSGLRSCGLEWADKGAQGFAHNPRS